MRTEDEITGFLADELPEGGDGPTRYPGMTYEQGVDAMAHWVLGDTDDRPLGG